MEIKVFSKNNCVQCQMAKRYLEENNVKFTEINIDDNPEYVDYLLDKGYRAVPVIETPTQAITGFAPNKLKELID
ncbi:MAG: glutaredoxin-like protein NrdH [Streptococcaceae bacterium]|jgi:glutaredoxin-like protein NrdH|nr:glutaredoxin-like protein NrdH [Streptococcaceae bacterium]